MDVIHWNKKHILIFTFLMSFLGLNLYYGNHQVASFRPQSIHVWRQTDCLSITQNYYQRNTPFFEPEIYNLISDGNTSGKTAGEFPILYFLVAQLWKVFGKHELIFRLFTLSLSFIGLFYLFRIADGFLQKGIQKLFIGLILFTSPAFVYYSFNFLPNVPGFALSMAGWYFIFLFYRNDRETWLWISITLFALAMLLKISAGIGFVALFGWCLLQIITSPEKRILFRQPVRQMLPFVCGLLIVIAWYSYASEYNAVHGGRYTFNNIWPIWELSFPQIKASLEQIRILWKKELFHPWLIYLTASMWMVLLSQWKKLSRISLWFLLLLPLGCMGYLLLWFQALDNHDYYFIDVLILVPFIWLMFFNTFKNKKWLSHPVASLILLIFLAFQAMECRKAYQARFSGWMNEWHENHGRAVGELESVLRKAGICPDDLVISLPDHSINASLYLMNQRGYTYFGSDFSNTEVFPDRIEKGARYLIVSDSSTKEDTTVKPFTRYPLITKGSVTVYDLRPFKANH